MLVADHSIQPSWNASSFLTPTSQEKEQAALACALFPNDRILVCHVSARDLKAPCPPSLAKALQDDYVDRSTWWDSYLEEKQGLRECDTYEEITLQEYRRLRRLPKAVPKAIPTMCVLTIKRDENMAPDRAKSRIVVLGNLEGRVWEKNEKYAPVLMYSSLRLLASMTT